MPRKKKIEDAVSVVEEKAVATEVEVKKTARATGRRAKAKIEVIEFHSETKLDAPSGTAIELAEEMAEKAPDKELSDIPYHSIRAGNTPSEHRVVFGCMGEKMEISHEAYDWRCYALGACDAAIYMYQKMKTDPSGGIGLYSMDDVIGI